MKALHPRESISSWLDEVSIPSYGQLTDELLVDVCIVGGGIAGMTTAYLLSLQGKKVCVLEDFEIGSGQTGRTTAQLSSALDERYYVLEKYHSEAGAKLAAESHERAIQLVQRIIEKEEIECDLEKVNGYLFAEAGDSPELLHHELEAILRAGVIDAYLAKKAPLDSFETGPAICFRNQLELNPLKYLVGLANLVIENNGQIFTHTHVTEVETGDVTRIHTANGSTVTCASVVVATNSPVNDIFAIHTKQAAYRTYVIGLQIPKGSVEKGFYWDTKDPYHYIRTEPDPLSEKHDILLIGGEDHKTGQNSHPETSYDRLESWARERFPFATEVTHRWSGQIMEPVDGLAYIGHNPLDKNNVYVITGHSGNGMTYATLGAMIITDQIMGRENPWEAIYQPSRISLRSAGTFIKKNVNSVAQYTDWLMEKQFGDIKQMKPGDGVVFRKGMKMIAAYKDELTGEMSFNSAVCPHLGGVVRWNNAEKSFDCPCHGSRFDCHGKVMEGPACSNLKPLEEKETVSFNRFRVKPNLEDDFKRSKNL